MFKKLINRSEESQVEMNDSALRDIIPSNDVIITKKCQQNRFKKICKIFIITFILGLIAIGIVVLALILAYSGKSLIHFLTHSSEAIYSPLSNKTRFFKIHHNNNLTTTTTSNEQILKKITVIPINNNQQIHISSPKISIKQEVTYTSTNLPLMSSYSSLNMISDEQLTSTNLPTIIFSTQQSTILSNSTINNQEYIHTSLENRMTTADTFTSTYLIQKIRNYEKQAITTQINLQTSTEKSTKQSILTKYKTIDEDIIDDLLFS